MAKQLQLNAKPRAESGTNAVKRLRARGLVPAVVYGAHTRTINIAVRLTDLEKLHAHATSENVLVDLQLEQNGHTANHLALIQEVQRHPVTDAILHVDFHEVSATEKLRTNVPVRAIGEPVGVKSGGVLEFIMRELRVECLPKDLPDLIEVNVETLGIGQAIHVRDIAAPPGVTLLDDKDQPVFIVVAPIAEEEAAPAAAEMAEPEVIGAKKEQPEAAEAGAAEAKPKPAETGKPEAKAPAAAKPEAKPASGKPEAKPPAAPKPEAKK